MILKILTNKRITFYFSFILFLIIPFIFLISDRKTPKINKLKIEENLNKIYSINSTLKENILCKKDKRNFIDHCFQSNISNKSIKIPDGLTLTSGIKIIGENITIDIPKESIIKLSPEVDVPDSFDGAKALSLIQIGTSEQIARNITINLNGILDGSREFHPYENGGIEGINIINGEYLLIQGNGKVHSFNGDGIDIDKMNNSLIDGISAIDNGASGFHYGSSRPIPKINTSSNNILMNITAINNGFLRKRNGIDISWPNREENYFINTKSFYNYRNYEIEGEKALVHNCISDRGKSTQKRDIFNSNQPNPCKYEYDIFSRFVPPKIYRMRIRHLIKKYILFNEDKALKEYFSL